MGSIKISPSILSADFSILGREIIYLENDILINCNKSMQYFSSEILSNREMWIIIGFALVGALWLIRELYTHILKKLCCKKHKQSVIEMPKRQHHHTHNIL